MHGGPFGRVETRFGCCKQIITSRRRMKAGTENFERSVSCRAPGDMFLVRTRTRCSYVREGKNTESLKDWKEAGRRDMESTKGG